MSIRTRFDRLQRAAGSNVRSILEGTVLSRYESTLIRIGSILVGLTIWELYAMNQPPYLFPRLGTIFAAYGEQMADFELIPSFVNSLQTLIAGYVLAALVGVAVGLAMGLNEWVETVLNPYINAFYVAPVSALVPILILIGGGDFITRVFVVFLFAVFEIIIDTYQGIETTPQGVLDVARSFGADRSFIVRKVILPHDIPYIFAGLRLGIGRAVKGMIIAELLIEFTNLGRIIRLWSQEFRIAGVLSIVLLLMLLGIVLTRAMQLIEERATPWQSEEVNV